LEENLPKRKTLSQNTLGKTFTFYVERSRSDISLSVQAKHIPKGIGSNRFSNKNPAKI